MYEKMVRLALVAVVIPAALVAAGCSSNPPPPPRHRLPLRHRRRRRRLRCRVFAANRQHSRRSSDWRATGGGVISAVVARRLED